MTGYTTVICPSFINFAVWASLWSQIFSGKASEIVSYLAYTFEYNVTGFFTVETNRLTCAKKYVFQNWFVFVAAPSIIVITVSSLHKFLFFEKRFTHIVQ